MPNRRHALLVASLIALAGCAPATTMPALQATGDLEAMATADWHPIGPLDARRVLAKDPGAPTAAENAELATLAGQRDATEVARIKRWNDGDPILKWSEVVRKTIAAKAMPQTTNARAMAFVHAAMHDALLGAMQVRAVYRRPAPPSTEGENAQAGRASSYPSEHAAIAWAATGALATLFPEDKANLEAQSTEAATTRLEAGSNYRADVEAGKALGLAAAAALAPRLAEGDGSSPYPLQKAQGRWWDAKPVTPRAGAWKTWVIPTAADLVPPPPMPGTPAFEQAADEVVTIAKAATAPQIAIAKGWDAEAPALVWNDRARHVLEVAHVSTPVAARDMAFFHMALADAFIAMWQAKYEYMLPRPSQVRDFQPNLAVPAHPSYPSHAGTAGAVAAAFLTGAVPEARAAMTKDSQEAAESRLWAGVHYRFDKDAGMALGKAIGEAAVKAADIR